MAKEKKDNSVEKEDSKDNAIAAKIRLLEKGVGAITKFLETMWNFDINKDGKIGLIIAAVGLSAMLAFGLSPNTNSIWNLTDSTGTNDLLQVRGTNGDLYVNGSIDAGAGAVAVGDVAIASNKIMIGNSSGVGAAYALSGDVTGNYTGAIAIAANAISGPEITAGAVSNVALASGIDAAKLGAGTTASAINGASITNIAGGNIASGNISGARITNGLSDVAIGVVEPNTNWVINAARLKAGSSATAINGNAITNINAQKITYASGAYVLSDDDIVGKAIPVVGALDSYDIIELSITNVGAGNWTNISLQAPGAGLVGKTIHIYTAQTNYFSIIRGSTLSGKADVVLNEAYEGITVIGESASKWLITNIHAP